jgi:hypothetical protein
MKKARAKRPAKIALAFAAAVKRATEAESKRVRVEIDPIMAHKLRDARNGLDRLRAWINGFQYGRAGHGQTGQHLLIEEQQVVAARLLLDHFLQEAERPRWVALAPKGDGP